MKVRLSLRAEQDLEHIADWIGEDNPSRAVSFFTELRDACLGLAGTARAYPVIRRFPGFELRRRAYKGYLILYQVTDVVDVLRVLHGARDIDGLLTE